MGQQLGKIIIFAGLIILVVGIIVYFFNDRLGWFGRLPGDIVINKPNVKIYFPITTMILASVILSLIIWIVRKLF